jgi:hypothetical protein
MSEHATLHGIVESYILNQKGKVEGLWLNENRQIKVPSHLRKKLTEAVAVGCTVTAEVKAGKVSDFGQEFELQKWLNGQAADEAQEKSARGQIKNWLVDKDGDLTGFIMDQGTQVRLPKSLRQEVHPWLKLGVSIVVHGHGSETPFGTVLKAQRLDPE